MRALVPLVESGVGWLIETWLHASLLALLVWAAQRLAGDRIAPRWRHAMWLVVAARLLLPAAPEAAYSPLRLLPWPAPDEVATGHRGGTTSVFVLPVAAGRDGAASTPSGAPASRPAQAVEGGAPSTTWRFWLGLAWLGGSAACLARLLFSTRRLRRELRGFVPFRDREIEEVLLDCARSMGIRVAPRLFVGPGVGGPALLGVFRPRILLPEDLVLRFSSDDLRFVLLHELAHLKRRDVAVRWVLACLEVVHWMNPIVWWAFARLREEAELACDEEVLALAREPGGARYGRVIIRLIDLASERAPRPGLVGGAFGARRLLERRLERLARFERRGRIWSAAGVLLVLSSAVTGLTKAPETGEIFTRTYEVGPLLRPEVEFAAPRLGFVKPSDEEEVRKREREAAEKDKQRKGEILLAAVRALAPPEAWTTGGSVSLEGDILVVNAPRPCRTRCEGSLSQSSRSEASSSGSRRGSSRFRQHSSRSSRLPLRRASSAR